MWRFPRGRRHFHVGRVTYIGVVSTPDDPQPTPDQNPETPPADGSEPIEKYIEVTPGQPVSFEVPANTNLVINVVNEKREGFLSSLWSGCSCLLTGVVVLVIVLYIIGSLS